MYKDQAKQREFARAWIADRKKKFFAGRRCESCGSRDNLRLFSNVPGKTIRQLAPWNNLSIPMNWYRIRCLNCSGKSKSSERKHRSMMPKTVSIKPPKKTDAQRQLGTWILSAPTPDQIQRAEEIGKRIKEESK